MIDWMKLRATVVKGDPSAPLVVALHGFGQTVAWPATWWHKMRPRFEFWHFPTMSGIVEEVERRNWSLYMPAAPLRDWRADHVRGDQSARPTLLLPSPASAFSIDQVATDVFVNGVDAFMSVQRRAEQGFPVSLLEAARLVTGSDGDAYGVGFSDGATLIALLMLMGAPDWRAFLVYSGMCPNVTPKPIARSLIVYNSGEPDRIQRESMRLIAKLRTVSADVTPRVVKRDGHNFDRATTPSLFDWLMNGNY